MVQGERQARKAARRRRRGWAGVGGGALSPGAAAPPPASSRTGTCMDRLRNLHQGGRRGPGVLVTI